MRWRTPIGSGYSGPAVAAGRVFTTDQFTPTNGPDVERVLCLAEADGKRLWTQEYPCRFNLSYPAGPRLTPTVYGGKVYTLGAIGLFGLSACRRAIRCGAGSSRRLWGQDSDLGLRRASAGGREQTHLPGRGRRRVAVAFDKDTGVKSGARSAHQSLVIRRQLFLRWAVTANSLYGTHGP